MKLVVQRVKKASVKINGKIKAEIDKGLLVFLGISKTDDFENIDWLVKKLINLRIFADKNNKMNLSVKDINGKILLVSQFTLYAKVLKGNRPDFMEAAKPNLAITLYKKFIEELSKNIEVKTGEFGANMEISLINDGPVTIIIER